LHRRNGTLFQLFVQTASGTQAREGTGLGLTISRRLLRDGEAISTSPALWVRVFSRFEVPITLVEQAQKLNKSARAGA